MKSSIVVAAIIHGFYVMLAAQIIADAILKTHGL